VLDRAARRQSEDRHDSAILVLDVAGNLSERGRRWHQQAPFIETVGEQVGLLGREINARLVLRGA
jgi:hypothetical protein